MKTVFYLVSGFTLGTFVSYLITGNGATGFIALIGAVVVMVLGIKMVK